METPLEPDMEHINSNFEKSFHEKKKKKKGDGDVPEPNRVQNTLPMIRA